MRLITTLGFTTVVALTALASACGTGNQVSNTGGGPDTGTGGAGAGTAGGNTGGTASTGGTADTGGTGDTGGATSTGGTASTGGAGDTGGTGGTGGAGNTGGATSTGGSGPCTPVTEDASKIGTPCDNGGPCPMGYTCQEFAGIAVSYYCAILCQDDCECPTGSTCVPKSDKVSNWTECSKP